MRIRVLFFGVLKEITGKSADQVEVPEGSTVADLLKSYGKHAPQLEKMLSSTALAVNEHYAAPETKLNANDEVALLPPVSGGSSPTSAETKTGGYAVIVRDPIDTGGILAKIKRGEDGAVLTFEGVVRNQTRGCRTLYLDYEAYEGMALQQLESLAREALRQYQIRDVAIVHRLGRLEIGETSVLIVVASAHRAAAFEACRWLIDTLKRTVPIWKKEYFEDGAVWADGEPFPEEIRRAQSS